MVKNCLPKNDELAQGKTHMALTQVTANPFSAQFHLRVRSN